MHKECTVCGEILETQIIPAIGHSYSEWAVTKEPTETEQGERKKVCEHCGHTVEAISTTGQGNNPNADNPEEDNFDGGDVVIPPQSGGGCGSIDSGDMTAIAVTLIAIPAMIMTFNFIRRKKKYHN